MSGLLIEQPSIAEGVVHLKENDPVFSKLPNAFFDINRNVTPSGLGGLVRTICGQQVSTKAADAIWGRVKDAMNPDNAQSILKHDEDSLRALGLSRPKARYILGAAEALIDGRLTPQDWHNMDDDAVFEQILALKGFGEWSVHMILLFSLARGNVWPAGDLGIQIGLHYYLECADRPNQKLTETYKEHFSPHASAAALLLWELKSYKESV